ncbi:hydrogenase iron-sulfur subunit [Chloroflexota bacterium]
MKNFTPKIILFCCNWGACCQALSDDNTEPGNNPELRIIHTMCSGEIEPTVILEAFNNGADGVMVAGCDHGDCHYNTGNYKARRRLMALQNMMEQFGIEPARLHMVWMSSTKAPDFQPKVDEFVGIITKIGPIALKAKVS